MPRRLTEVSDVQALIDAVKAGDSGQVQALIDADPTLVNTHADSGESAVLLAAYYGHRDIAELLVLRGANLTVFEASAIGQAARVEALLAHDPSLVNAFSPDGFTPLGLAAFFGHADVVDYLLAQGAQVNVPSRNGLSVMPLHSAVAAQNLEISHTLLAHGAAVNATQQDGYTSLHEAAQNGQLDMIHLLLAYGADPVARKADGETPAQTALKAGHPDAAKLIEDGHPVNEQRE
jgi:ankyrin repeat protein